jgi:tetratricopeptide (TPR) repeat protein
MAEANAAIEQGGTPLKDNHIARAQLYQIVGNAKRAEECYQQALAADPQNVDTLRQVVAFVVKTARAGKREEFTANVQKAQPYLEQIVQITKDATDPKKLDALGWARRTQAEIVAASGSYDDVIKARKIIEQNARDGKLTPADIQTIVDMLARRPEPESRAAALKLLEQLQTQRPLLPREQLVLGQLYERGGNWARAKELFVNSLTQQSNDPEALLAFAQSLIEHAEYDDAARWLDTADELLTKVDQPVTERFRPAARELRAKLLVKTGHPDQAIAALRQLVPSPLPPSQLGRLAQVSQLMERLELYDAAKQLLDEYVQQDPRGTIAMAAYIGRRGQLDESFKLLEEARKNQSVTEIIPCALESLRKYPEQATAERFSLIEQWGQAGLQTEPDSSRIKMLLAEAYDLQGKYAEVEKLYREVLAEASTTPLQAAMVKNNLAFTLAVTKQNLPEALKLINESISVMGPNSDLLDTRGVVYFHQGDLDKAIADLRVSAIDAPTVNKYFHLAQAERKAENLDAARNAMARAEELGAAKNQLTPAEQKSFEQLLSELK